MSSIQALKARTAWVRLVDSDEPRLLRTVTIKPAFLGNERETAQALAGFAEEALQKLPYAIRRSELQPVPPVAAVDEPADFSVPAAPRATVESDAEVKTEKTRARRRTQPATPRS